MDVLGQDKREGLGRKANSRFVLLLLMLISGILLLSSLYAAEASVFKKARETVMDVSEPVLAFFAGPIGFFQEVVGNVEDYFSVLERNQALREENTELRQWMDEALQLREIVSEYEKLQTYRPPPEATPVDAYVVGESNDVYVHSMIVDAGKKDSVQRGDAVVDGLGLVGHIVDVGADSSRILLLTDIQSRIPVYIEGANVNGILVGRSKGNPVVRFTENSEPVNLVAEQRVLTSGDGGSLPRGLPIGVIKRVQNEEVIVGLFSNYARTRLVRILNYEFTALQDSTTDASGPEVAPAAEVSEETAAPGADG